MKLPHSDNLDWLAWLGWIISVPIVILAFAAAAALLFNIAIAVAGLPHGLECTSISADWYAGYGQTDPAPVHRVTTADGLVVDDRYVYPHAAPPLVAAGRKKMADAQARYTQAGCEGVVGTEGVAPLP